MISQRVLRFLVLPLPVLAVAFAVSAGGAFLSRAAGDDAAGAVLGWVSVAMLMLGAIDLVLLVAALGIRALEEPDERRGPGGPRDE